MIAKRVSLAGLILILALDVWWRCHTIGPTIRDHWGVSLWPVMNGSAEPLDCDESAYAYMGRRMVRGDVLYRDLTENKPPLGYWLYALTVAIGGATETTIRLMPIPMVLATIGLCWWIAMKVAGRLAALIAAIIYAVMSTDPFLYGNGANLEHAMNLFATAALGAFIGAWPRHGRAGLVVSGVLVGAAALVKQVAAVPLLAYAVVLALRKNDKGEMRPIRARLLDEVSLLAGFLTIWTVAASILIAQDAGVEAFDDIVRYGGALATHTPPDLKEKPFLIRFFTGNTDPNGHLPWPFGATLGRAWWAAGCWPLWGASIPCLAWVGLGRRDSVSRIVALWTISAWIQVAMPRLFWQHYYLLPLPGVALTIAIAFSDTIEAARRAIVVRQMGRLMLALATVFILGAAIAGTVLIQIREYLLVPPEILTARDKGGEQWIVLRDFGRELSRVSEGWRDPRLFVWGIHSPLYLYSGMDSVTPHFFADPLITTFANSDHPLIRPRAERIVSDLKAHPPDIVFLGQPPFPSLIAFVRANYIVANLPIPKRPQPIPIWVRKDRAGELEAKIRRNPS